MRIETRCKVCMSINLEKYERLLKQKFSFEDMSAVAKKEGENISYKAFYRHKNRHMKSKESMSEELKEIRSKLLGISAQLLSLGNQLNRMEVD